MSTTLLATIGIMSAMPQESSAILDLIKDQEVVQIGIRKIIKGTFQGVPVVFTPSGVGKVSAAVTTTLLIIEFGVDEIVYTGVAGGGAGVDVGDIVIGSSYLQHDLILPSNYPLFYIFSLDAQVLHATPAQVTKMKAAVDRYLHKGVSFPDLGIKKPKVHVGTIVSGDQFISNSQAQEKIVKLTKELLPNGFQAIEMEGCAVAQVCKELNVPFVIFRSISDKADHKAEVDFLSFIDDVATKYTLGILKEYIHTKEL